MGFAVGGWSYVKGKESIGRGGRLEGVVWMEGRKWVCEIEIEMVKRLGEG